MLLLTYVTHKISIKWPVGFTSNWKFSEVEKVSGKPVGVNFKTMQWTPADNFGNIRWFSDEPAALTKSENIYT